MQLTGVMTQAKEASIESLQQLMDNQQRAHRETQVWECGRE